MIRTDRRVRIRTLLLIANLAFIWGNSLLPGEISGAFSNWVKSFLAQFLPMENSGTGGIPLRKLAHFTEFAALGVLLSWRFSMTKGKIRTALPLGFLAACVDETIQRFVPGRGPSIRDVGIDTCGVLAGMLVLQIGYLLWRKQKPIYMEENNQ